MNLDLWKQAFLYCTLINFGVLASWGLLLVLPHEWAYRLWARVFRLSAEQFDATNANAIVLYKLGVFLLNVAPYLALLWISTSVAPSAQLNWHEQFSRGEQSLKEGDYATANQALTSALGSLRSAGVPESDSRLPLTLSRLGTVKFNTGDYDEAASLIGQALDIWERTSGANSLSAAVARFDLGEIQIEQMKHGEAERNLRAALHVLERVLAPSDPRRLRAGCSLGVLAVHAGRMDEAETSLDLALRSLRSTTPPLPSVLSNCLNAAGLLQVLKSDFSRAESLLSEAVAVQERSLGRDHPSTVATNANLGMVLVQRGEYARAEPLLRKSIQLGERKFGPDYPYLARPVSDLALLQITQGKYSMAESTLKRALFLSEKAGGIDLSFHLARLTRAYFEQGKFEQAKSTLLRILQVVGSAPQFRRDRAIVTYNLGHVYAALREPTLAETCFVEAIRALEQDAPQGDSNLIAALHAYAGLIRPNRPAEAREIDKRIKSIRALSPSARVR